MGPPPHPPPPSGGGDVLSGCGGDLSGTAMVAGPRQCGPLALASFAFCSGVRAFLGMLQCRLLSARSEPIQLGSLTVKGWFKGEPLQILESKPPKRARVVWIYMISPETTNHLQGLPPPPPGGPARIEEMPKEALGEPRDRCPEGPRALAHPLCFTHSFSMSRAERRAC